MSRHTRRIATMASLGLAIVFSGAVSAQVDERNEQLMDLVLKVQQLQDEIRMLRGQLDEQKYELENVKRRQRDQYLDLDQRIGELGEGAPAAQPALGATAQPVVTPEAGPAAVQTAPAQAAPEVTERADRPSDVVALGTPQAATSTAAATPEAQQAAYDEAFQALKELRYADAATNFQSFLDSYPDSELAGNAQYWLGESYYVTRNYEIALDAFEALVKDYPDSTKRSAGLLKIGFTHYELAQYDQARAALEQVQREFPNTSEARLAESRLRSMRLEGQF